jgi:hypothetical protein
VEAVLGAHDPTLRSATAATRGRALHPVEGLHEKALRALKKRDQGRADRLRRTRDVLLPGGSLQERGIGFISFVGAARPRRGAGAGGAPAAVRARAPGGVAVRLGNRLLSDGGRLRAVAAELAKQLARRGHEIHVISYRLPFRLGGFQQNICFHEVDVSSYPLFEYPPHELALAVKMAEAARDHALELFHVHYAIPHAIAASSRSRCSAAARRAWSRRCTAPTSRSWARTARSSRSRASGSSARMR